MAVVAGEFSSGKTLMALKEIAGVSLGPIGKAAVVAREAPELVDQVLAGGSLNDAYRIATDRKRKDSGRWRWYRRDYSVINHNRVSPSGEIATRPLK